MAVRPFFSGRNPVRARRSWGRATFVRKPKLFILACDIFPFWLEDVDHAKTFSQQFARSFTEHLPPVENFVMTKKCKGMRTSAG